MRTRTRTRTSERILFFITQYHAENGYSPSWKEIAQAVDLQSVSTVSHHMNRLRAAGQIDYKDGQPRTVVVLGKGGRE